VTALRYTLDEFIHDMTALVAAQPEQARLFDKGSAYIERLVADERAIPTVEIHVYGTDLVGLQRCQYNLETGAVRRFASGKYDNC
jgi:predicted metal-dependent enzyme (double-stranded beta helix superfamily)